MSFPLQETVMRSRVCDWATSFCLPIGARLCYIYVANCDRRPLWLSARPKDVHIYVWYHTHLEISNARVFITMNTAPAAHLVCMWIMQLLRLKNWRSMPFNCPWVKAQTESSSKSAACIFGTPHAALAVDVEWMDDPWREIARTRIGTARSICEIVTRFARVSTAKTKTSVLEVPLSVKDYCFFIHWCLYWPDGLYLKTRLWVLLTKQTIWGTKIV